MVENQLIHFETWNTFLSNKGVNGNYSTPSSGKEEDGTAVYGQIKGTSIVFIKDVGKIWTHGKLYCEVIVDNTVNETSTNPVENRAVKTYVDNAVQAVTNELVIDEEIWAEALTSLESRIIPLEQNMVWI